jgi:hypothetical protein
MTDMDNLKPGDKLEATATRRTPSESGITEGFVYIVRSVDCNGHPILTTDAMDDEVGWNKHQFRPVPEEPKPADDTTKYRVILAKDMAEQFNPETMEWDDGPFGHANWSSIPVDWDDVNPDKPIVVRDKPKPVSLAEAIDAYPMTGGRFDEIIGDGKRLADYLIEAGYATEYPRSES